MIKEAMLYEKLQGEMVGCGLCAHRCKIKAGNFGLCGVRQNIDGILKTLVYEEVVAADVDPIEKKPLYHFLPGTTSFSIAAMGCNFRCGFCQNWQISQLSKKDGSLKGQELACEDVVRQALAQGCASISYTYTEPTTFFEYAFDTAKLAKAKGLKNVFVSNGYMTAEALKKISPYLDAINIDLKSFQDEFYQRICKARLQPVFDSIKLAKELGIWVEVTTLVIPNENDSDSELKDIAQFIAAVAKDIPWHISAFYPDYKFNDHGSTPLEILERAYKHGKDAGLRYVYLGNVSVDRDSLCYNCGKVWEERTAKCLHCGVKIDGIFS